MNEALTSSISRRPAPKNTRTYEALRERALNALDAAEFRKSKKLFEWSHTEAKRIGRPVLMERSYCNIAVTAAEMGDAHRYLDRLRSIAGQSTDTSTRSLAARRIALVFYSAQSHQKAGYYGELAYQLACRARSREDQTRCAHDLGVLRLADWRLDEARSLFEESMSRGAGFLPADDLALVRSNLGFCLQRL